MEQKTEQKKIDLQSAPKQFADRVTGGFTQDHFILALFSGTNGSVYALTPEHMKRLSQWMAFQVTEYEKKHHAIEAEWVPGQKSPIQNTDLGKNE